MIKPITKTFLRIALLVFLSHSPGFAQSSSNKTVEGPAGLNHISGRIPILEIAGGTIKAAVFELHNILESQAMEPINVILAPDTESRPVPELTLRNVTGLDALQLTASAAGCTVEPVKALSGEGIAGYKLVAAVRWGITETPAEALRSTFIARSPQKAMVPGSSNPYHADPFVGRTYRSEDVASEMVAPEGSSRLGGGGPRYGEGYATGSIFRYGSGNAPEKPIQSTRVYPLGAVTASTKLLEIEATLQDLLAVDGESSNGVKLAFHEKTKVLVVKGTESAHTLVSELLASLSENQKEDLNRKNESFDRASASEITQLQIRLEAQIQANERLQKQLAQAENEARELAKVNRQLKDMANKQ
ncbi:MAG: hypothetical protein O2960_22585 [Verrucomicrobia bacterium]|nr:hypothetical protein [Verrucomicrobiota bacterium]